MGQIVELEAALDCEQAVDYMEDDSKNVDAAESVSKIATSEENYSQADIESMGGIQNIVWCYKTFIRVLGSETRSQVGCSVEGGSDTK